MPTAVYLSVFVIIVQYIPQPLEGVYAKMYSDNRSNQIHVLIAADNGISIENGNMMPSNQLVIKY